MMKTAIDSSPVQTLHLSDALRPACPYYSAPEYIESYSISRPLFSDPVGRSIVTHHKPTDQLVSVLLLTQVLP